MCGDRSVQEHFVALHILLFGIYGVSHHSLHFTYQYFLFRLFLGITFKLFPYFPNVHYYRLYIAYFHIGNPLELSIVMLEAGLSPLWGVYDPLFFSVIGDAVNRFLYSWYEDYVGYTLWVDPGIHSSQFSFLLITNTPAL